VECFVVSFMECFVVSFANEERQQKVNNPTPEDTKQLELISLS
jgi:hypothetical protein